MAHNIADNPDILPQKVVVFGPPGSGKTELIGKLAQEFKLIWFDLESGSETLLKLPVEWRRNITLIKIRDTTESPRAHSTIDKILKGGKFKICDDHGSVDCKVCARDYTGDNADEHFTNISIPTRFTPDDYKTIIVIDSMSQLTISVNSSVNILANNVITPDSIPGKEQQDEWGNQQKFLNNMLSFVQNAPFHVAVTAHEAFIMTGTAKDKNGRLIKDTLSAIVPSIGTNNYANNCSKFFGHKVYVNRRNLKHKAWSGSDFDNRIVTASRTDARLEDMAEPSLITIFNGEVPTIDTRKQQAAAVLNNLPSSALASGGVGGLSNMSKFSGLNKG